MSPQEKDVLRREFSAKRESLSHREERSRAIAKALWELPAYQRAQQLLLYVSKGSEPDTWTILDRALEEGKQVYAPRCLDGRGAMGFFRVESREQLMPGRFGLLEPDETCCPKLGKLREALCLVPGLAFDREGFRLGYGKGYYDRFLAGYSGEAVGLCYQPLVVPKLPRDGYDQKVHLILTEAGALSLGGTSPRKEGCE